MPKEVSQVATSAESSSSSSSSSYSSSSSSDSESSSYDSSSCDTSSSGRQEKIKETQQSRGAAAPSTSIPRVDKQAGSADDPCYEDFMPSKEIDLPKQSVSVTGESIASAPVKPEGLSKEDLIEILTEALDRSSQREENRKRARAKSSDSEQEPRELEVEKGLGTLSASVVAGGSSSTTRGRGRPPSKHPKSASTSLASLAEPEKHRKPVSIVSNTAWKKKLAALQKTQLQLSGRISALLDSAQ